MDTYLVIARRYRPQTFEEVVGQRHVARTLKNAILEGRIGHAYVFAGPRGVGKTSMARIFAKALNCRTGPTETPCQTCDICRAVTDGSDPDVVEIDAASNRGIDEIRELREKILYAPLRARFKIYILDEAHQITWPAFNAFLKTLEEPPPHVKFVFATTNLLKLPETILSRCQRFDFHRIPLTEIRQALRVICDKERVACADEVLTEIAAAGDGSMRDAESLLDQLLAFTEDAITSEDVSQLLGALPRARVAAFFRAVAARDGRRVLETVQAIFDEGRDPEAVCEQAIGFLRDALLVAACGPSAPGLDLPPDGLPAVEASAKDFPPETSMYFIQLLSEAHRRMKDGLAPRVVLEVAALKMARWEDLASVSDLAARLQGSEVPVSPSPVPGPPADVSAAARRGANAEASARAVSPAPAAIPPPPATAAARPRDDDARPQASDLGPRSGESEAPAPAEAPPPAADGDLARHWPAIQERVRAKKFNLAGYLREARPVSLQGSEFTIVFPAEFRMHKAQVEEASNRQIVEAAASAVLGLAVTLHCTISPGGAGAAAGAPRASPARVPARQRADVISDPGVKRVLEEFSGRVVGVGDGTCSPAG